MTRLSAFIALLPFLAIGCDSGTSQAVDESKEPALKYDVKLGETIVTISEGETVQLDGTFANPNISITPHSHRVFPYQGLTFKYPRSFTFEADLEESDAKHWTLSGNDFKIMYFVLDGSVTTSDFANNMIDQVGRGNATIVNANASISLGTQRFSGTSLRVAVATHQIATDIYRIPSRGTKTKLLVFQDSLDDSGNRSKEYNETINDIASSFTVEQ